MSRAAPLATRPLLSGYPQARPACRVPRAVASHVSSAVADRLPLAACFAQSLATCPAPLPTACRWPPVSHSRQPPVSHDCQPRADRSPPAARLARLPAACQPHAAGRVFRTVASRPSASRQGSQGRQQSRQRLKPFAWRPAINKTIRARSCPVPTVQPITDVLPGDPKSFIQPPIKLRIPTNCAVSVFQPPIKLRTTDDQLSSGGFPTTDEGSQNSCPAPEKRVVYPTHVAASSDPPEPSATARPLGLDFGRRI